MTRNQSTLVIGALAAAAFLARGMMRRRRLSVEGRVVLITGGSRGLGLLIARELSRLGARVVIVARNPAELDRARTDPRSVDGVEAGTIIADITNPDEATRIVEETVAQYGRLDVLVNNAGVITVGPVDHMTRADFDDAMAVHFWGPLHTMRAAIPHMRRVGGGRIVNISSIGGKIGVPHLVPYCASKFALTGLSTAMRGELIKHNILVTTVAPGLMRTGSPFNARFKGRHREEFARFAIADSPPLISIDGTRAAAQIVDAARRGDAELVVSWPAKLAVIVATLLPDPVAAAMGLVNRVLPSALDQGSVEVHSGWQSSSAWAPSLLTRPTERAAVANNEIPSPQPHGPEPRAEAVMSD
jgi:NAD(P)-dependent dehydrogenase (short-subunit alcohol dehydrogenase family)